MVRFGEPDRLEIHVVDGGVGMSEQHDGGVTPRSDPGAGARVVPSIPRKVST